MATAPPTKLPAANPGVPAKQAYVIAALCLVIGLTVGYFFLGGSSSPRTTQSKSPMSSQGAPDALPGGHPQLTLDQMKQMADVKASTLIEKSKADPTNTALLLQVASIYQASHQFKEASDYFGKVLKIDPKNTPARTELASCLYYSGDVDGALSQLQQALKIDPKDVNALFNLGMIKYRGKKDAAGAIAAWQQLLKANPNLDRKSQVEQLIAEAKSSQAVKN